MDNAPKNLNPLDKWAAFQKMMDSVGWKLFEEEVSKIGDDIMEKILDTNLSGGKLYTLRDLCVFQADTIYKITHISKAIKEDADVFEHQNKPQGKEEK